MRQLGSISSASLLAAAKMLYGLAGHLKRFGIPVQLRARLYLFGFIDDLSFIFLKNMCCQFCTQH
jgi:hypothetical protein